MFRILGKITRRIVSGEIPADSINPPRSQPAPNPDSLRHARGFSLGAGPERDGTHYRPRKGKK